MIDILTKEEIAKLEEESLIPLQIPLPLPKERIVEESDEVEEEGNRHSTIIEIDIT